MYVYRPEYTLPLALENAQKALPTSLETVSHNFITGRQKENA